MITTHVKPKPIWQAHPDILPYAVSFLEQGLGYAEIARRLRQAIPRHYTNAVIASAVRRLDRERIQQQLARVHVRSGNKPNRRVKS